MFYAPHLLDQKDLALQEGDQFKAFPARTIDNPFVGKEVHDSLVNDYGMDTPLYRQELLGEHVIAEGLVYPTWNRDFFMRPVREWPVSIKELVQGGRVYGGIDFGFRNPSCLGVFGYDGRGRRYLMDGLYKVRLTDAELITEALRYQRAYNVRAFAGDPSDPGWRVAARRAGVRVVKAINRKGSSRDTSFGIGACTAVLNARMPDGSPMFFVNPALQWFADEIEEYTEEESIRDDMNLRERARQSADHAMDMWRYEESLVNLRGGSRRSTSGNIKMRIELSLPSSIGPTRVRV